MCELLGVTAGRKIRINGFLETFFSHSVEHRNGWGLALLDEDVFSIEREPIKAIDSSYLKSMLKGKVETSGCIAHIRNATIGEVNENNTHPFSMCDDFGRRWVLAHNGTIFDSEVLAPYQYTQIGTTDSERILLYIVDRINKGYRNGCHELNKDERIHTVEEAIKAIVPGNKVNLMIYDGELFYVHKNEPGTLYEKDCEGGVMFATVPLEPIGWHEFAQNQLMVYRDGELVCAGEKHDNTYIHNEEQMKLLYFTYSGL